MPDPIFEDVRLVSIYDAFDGDRSDLALYLSIAKELKARSVLDLGCGTGCFAGLLNEQGFEVIGVDPAAASLEVARQKPAGKGVRWLHGDAKSLPPLVVDLAVMTGNVAQVFLTDESWRENLIAIRRCLGQSGHLVFEVRDPSSRAWLNWSRERTYRCIDVPNVGQVEGWCEVLSITDEIVNFRWTYVFHSDGKTLVSDSALRFRSKAEISRSLVDAGFSVTDIRDAPDRPAQEFVFIAVVNRAVI